MRINIFSQHQMSMQTPELTVQLYDIFVTHAECAEGSDIRHQIELLVVHIRIRQ